MHTGVQWGLLPGRGPHKQVPTDRQGMLGQFSCRQPRCSVRISCGLAGAFSSLSPISLPSSWASTALSQPLLTQPTSAFPRGHPPPHTRRPPNHHIPHPRSPHIHMLCATHACSQAHYTTHRDMHTGLTSWLASSRQKVLFPAA